MSSEPQEQIIKACEAVRMLKAALQNGPPQNEETYKQQLQWKNIIISDAMNATSKNLQFICRKLVKDCNGKLMFKVDYIRGCPLDVTYANRYLAYSGVDKNTDEWSLDYNSLVGGTKVKLHPSSVLAKPIKLIQEFIQESDKPLYNPRTKQGFWYSIMARSSHVGNVMLLVTIHTETEEQAVRECKALAPQVLTLYEGAEAEIVSLVLKATYERSGEYIEVVIGNEYMDDEVAGLKFQIYPKSFFWSNHFGAKTLCETIAELLNLDKNSVAIDVGCSNGIIGMYLSKFCNKVFMMDRVASSVKEAAQNVALNGIDTCEFLENRLHKNLDFQEKLIQYTDVAAILNDDFNARNTRDARSIRELESVNKLVYISKANRDSDRNLVTLCGNKGNGIPFVPVRAIPIDMNPEIIQVEVVFLLERSPFEVKVETVEGTTTVDNKDSQTLPKRNDDYSPPPKNFKFDEGRSSKHQWNTDVRHHQSRSQSGEQQSGNNNDSYFGSSYSQRQSESGDSRESGVRNSFDRGLRGRGYGIREMGYRERSDNSFGGRSQSGGFIKKRGGGGFGNRGGYGRNLGGGSSYQRVAGGRGFGSARGGGDGGGWQQM